MSEFAGRTVVVTGGARGLGAAYARGFAGDGARVILIDRDADVHRVADEIGGFAHVCDLGDADALAKLGEAVLADAPRLDLLINNAGIAYGDIQDRSRLATYTASDWRLFLGVNTVAPMLLAAALRPALAAAGGSILNQSSMASTDPESAYGVTKAALNAMTRAMATAFGDDGIRVNAIAPGLIADEAQAAGLPEAFAAQVRYGQILDRRGSAEDIVALARFLASDAARFITGEVVFCDGGSNRRHWRY